MAKSWTERARQQEKDRKAMQKHREDRARRARAEHRKAVAKDPAGSFVRWLFG